MKLGQGNLTIAILGRGIPDSQLAKLATQTFSIVPLNELIGDASFYQSPVHPPYEESQHKSEEDLIRRIKHEVNPNLVAVIFNKGRWGRYVPEKKLSYSCNQVIVLAHEIGHAMGLEHPEECRAICSIPESECESSKYIMGCGARCTGSGLLPYASEPMVFSPSDVEKLRMYAARASAEAQSGGGGI